jgi:capsular polysaccharide biosynthesis protein
MAVQIEARGQIQEFLEVLRRRAWQIAVPAVFVITIGSCLAVIIPRKFLAKTQLELRQVGTSTIGKEGQNAKFQIKAPARVKKVVEELKSPVYQALGEMERRDFLRDIDKNLGVDWTAPGQQSSIFITITYTDLDRAWAGSFLKALRDDWKSDVLEQDRNKLKEEAKSLGTERDKLRTQYENEEEVLSKLKKGKGISAMQPIPGAASQHSEDPEYDRLQNHRGDLAEMEIKLAEKRGRKDHLEKDYAAMPPKIASEKILPGATHAKEIQDTSANILELQNKLREYKPANSRYPKIQEEISALERKRDALEGLVTGSEHTTLMVDNPERAKKRDQIDEVKSEMASLEARQKSLIATISVEEANVSDLHEVYRDVRLSEERIGRFKIDLQTAELSYLAKVRESEVASNRQSDPFAILEEVSVPPKATEPNPWLIVALSAAAGLGLGVGIAVLLEYSKSCFRSVYDISRVMAAPVLGNINSIVTRRERRQSLTRRVLVGSASFLLLGSLAFVTWAWAHDQDTGLLSPALRKAIEGLRSVLK